MYRMSSHVLAEFLVFIHPLEAMLELRLIFLG